MRLMTRGARCAIWLLAALTGCASPKKELERVAKDWCMTIRASQVLPVYPLSEDIQPGDVFVVQVPLAKQPEIYAEKGFLALDQLATRLSGLAESYDAFYGDGYWRGSYSSVPHFRPGWPDAESAADPSASPPPVHAPRVAFPTYRFEVDASAGLNLALPLSGVPVGLGVMNASKATGTVSLQDAYTYAVDIETLLRKLHLWWKHAPGVRDTLEAVAGQSDSEVYLRVVNRVYLTQRLVVSLTNLDALSGGVDAAAASVPKLLDFTDLDAEQVGAAGDAYKRALEALEGPLGSATPGGSFRFTQASQRAVTMDQTFDRPLVIGYLGFDVRVGKNGELSPPIPSYAVLNEQVESFPAPRPYVEDPLSDLYLQWLPEENHFQLVEDWLAENEIKANPADLANDPAHRATLQVLSTKFSGFASSASSPADH